MTIWADADSLPRDVRDILLRRGGARFVASKRIPGLPPEAFVLVEQGPDAADAHIEESASPGDLVVTRDIPLAERLAERGIAVINDSGAVYTAENAAERRSLRDRMAELRNLGLAPESPRGSSRGPRETKRFADALDRTLSKLARG